MISRNSESGFFATHWDWIVAGLGFVALVVGAAVFFCAGESDPEACAEAAVSRLMAAKKAGTDVKAVDLDEYERTLQLAAKPVLLGEVADDAGSFLVSARRIFCHHCAKPIRGADKKCPLCGGVQPEPEKVAVDTDGDGLTDEWEEQFGLDPKTPDADEDKDGDGFTNAEEFAAGTNPNDKDSHPDYFDALQLQLPLKETVLPFYLRSYMKTPGGMKLEFFDPKRRNDYGKNGYRYAVAIGEPIGDTGFVAKNFEQKSAKKKIKGSNVERTVDVSTATIERQSDGKTLVLVLEEKRKPVDVQATILFSRGEPRQSIVVPGGALVLYGKKYKIVDVKGVGKGAKVTIEDPLGKIRTLEALE